MAVPHHHYSTDPDLRAVVEGLQRQLRCDLDMMLAHREWSAEQLETAAGVAPGTLRGELLDLSAIASLAYVCGYVVDVRFKRPARPPLTVAVDRPLAESAPR